MLNILRRLKLWQKFAALGAIGAVMCAIPLTQVVQYKQADLAVARSEEVGLEPVRTLLTLQKHLQAHRGLAGMVLAGNATADGERRARQADVDSQIASLDKQLAGPTYAGTVDPVKALKTGWKTLSQKVESRSISARDSFEAHTALVDQTIAVIELVADASGLSLSGGQAIVVSDSAGRPCDRGCHSDHEW